VEGTFNRIQTMAQLGHISTCRRSIRGFARSLGEQRRSLLDSTKTGEFHPAMAFARMAAAYGQQNLEFNRRW